MRTRKIYLLCLVLFATFSCKEKFEPNLPSTTNSYLVVDGILNTGTGTTSIRLTRSIKLDRSAQIVGELNAKVTVEGKDNSIRTLTSSGNGNYTSPALNLTLDNDYRLRIKTVDGKEYLSAYVTARLTPPIDSVGWHRTDKGVQLYVNTGDPANKTTYYRWEYDATWEIRTYFNSQLKYLEPPPRVVYRTAQENVSTCWKYGSSSNILLGSSARLQSDKIFEAPLILIPTGDEKLAVRYSLLLRQYSLDKDGFAFYELLKKNTESLGTVFDAQPSETRGNIICVSNPAELVIGYITARSIHEKRIFISSSQLPGWLYRESCAFINVPNIPDSLKAFFGDGQYIPITTFEDPDRPGPPRILGSFAVCVDCTARGGSLIKPSYW